MRRTTEHAGAVVVVLFVSEKLRVDVVGVTALAGLVVDRVVRGPMVPLLLVQARGEIERTAR